MPDDTPPVQSPGGTDDAEVRRRARAIIEELGLTSQDLDRLFLAANVTADGHQTQAYQLWLGGQAPSPDIDPRRLLTLLELRKQRRAQGNEL